ncbi:MAG: hypothetical protein ACE5NG_15250 [bacterium]
MKRNIKKLNMILAVFTLVFLPRAVFAHCPLCTIGAGALAVLAAKLGVSVFVIGIWLGAFGLALGLWIGRLIIMKFKRKFIPYQTPLIGLASFAATILPLRLMFKEYTSLYLPLAGDYGSLLNRTYVLDVFVIGSIAGAVVLALAPYLSRLVTRLRGRKFPYQHMAITFGLLLLVSVVIEIVI